MAEPGAVRSRLAAGRRWLAPSVVGGLVGALVAGLVEGGAAPSLLGLAVTAGFVALALGPVLVGLAILGRGVLAGWQPRTRFAGWREAGGGMPQLAGWIVTVGVCAYALAVLMVRGTWIASRATAFGPRTMQLVYPLLAVGAGLVVVALSRPLAGVIAAAARALDRRWQARGHRTLLAPRRLLGALAAGIVAALALAWFVVVAPRIGPFDASPLRAPALGLAVCIALVTAWQRLGRARRAIAAAGIVATLGMVATALATIAVRPAETLEVWGQQPIAGAAIETLFDLESIRTRVALSRFRPTAKPGAVHPDIILVTIDTVRADHTPPYGGKAKMPVLAELARAGTVFEWAFAPSNVTRRSIASIITGLAADRVRGRVVGWALRLDPRHVVLAERLSAGGYETAGFMCCEGFWGEKARTGWQRGLSHLELERDGHELAKRAAAWLAAREARGATAPLFLWIHILEPHNWTAQPNTTLNDVAGDRHRLYDRSLEESDTMLGTLLAPFAERAPGRGPIVVVTADHGEAIGEHGAVSHSTDLYNSQMRVPLVVAGPGIRQGRVTESVSLVGITPTVLDLAGFDVRDTKLDGVSMASLATGARASRDDGRAFAAMVKDRSNPGGVTAYVKGRWKLIRMGERTELYDMHADPNELADLALSQPAVRAELEHELALRNAAALLSPFE